MPHHDSVPKKKKKKLIRLIQHVFIPSRHGNNRQIKKPWWQKFTLHHDTKRKQEKKPYMDWTTLSPNEPPLPFLIQSSPSSSELAPINKV